MSGELRQTFNGIRMLFIKRWVADPQSVVLPKDISFGEMHAVLDELEDRIDEVREMYPAIPED